jgi:tetratricopeptide (TPR) repeat protein
MSKRRPSRAEKVHPPFASNQRKSGIFHPLWLIYIAMILMGFGGGMLYDRAGNVSDPVSLLYHLILPVIYLLVSISALITLFRSSDRFKLDHAVIAAIGAFILWTGIFIYPESNHFIGLTVWSQFACALMIAWMIHRNRTDVGKIEPIILLILLASTFVALFGVNEYLSHFAAGNKNWRVFGNFVNPDFLAGFLLMSIPVTLAMHLGFDFHRFAEAHPKPWGYMIVLMGLNIAGIVFLAFGTGSILYFLHAGEILFAITLTLITVTLAVYILQSIKERNLPLFTARMVRLWCILSLILQSVCLILTQSRFGLAAFLLEIAYMAVILVWQRQLRGESIQRAIRIAIVVAILGIMAAGPVWLRLRNAQSQAYSLDFRIFTWRGALKMAEARFLSGFGPGSFDDKYQRFAYVGYTQHAHGGFLQLLAESGIVGLLLFAFIYIQAFRSSTRKATHGLDTENWYRTDLLLTGISAALVGAFLHNLVDSDLYVPVSCLVMGALFGLALSLDPAAKDASGILNNEHGKSVIHTFGLIVASVMGIAAVIIVIFSGTNLISRLDGYQGETELMQQDYPDALASYKKAEAVNPLDSRYGLRVAALEDAMGQTEAANQTYVKLARSIPIAKVYYLAGQFYQRHGNYQNAIREYMLAQAKDPHNLENLVALAEAQTSIGDTIAAEKTYERLTRLYYGPVGQIKAIPELPDWQYPVGFLGLAQCEFTNGKEAQAETDLETGLKLCKQFWHVRNQQIFQISINPVVLREFVTRYEWGLTRLAEIRVKEGRVQEANALTSLEQQVQSELIATLKKLTPVN